MFDNFMADDFLLVVLTIKTLAPALFSSSSFLGIFADWTALNAAWRVLSLISALVR